MVYTVRLLLISSLIYKDKNIDLRRISHVRKKDISLIIVFAFTMNALKHLIKNEGINRDIRKLNYIAINLKNILFLVHGQNM